MRKNTFTMEDKNSILDADLQGNVDFDFFNEDDEGSKRANELKLQSGKVTSPSSSSTPPSRHSSKENAIVKSNQASQADDDDISQHSSKHSTHTRTRTPGSSSRSTSATSRSRSRSRSRSKSTERSGRDKQDGKETTDNRSQSQQSTARTFSVREKSSSKSSEHSQSFERLPLDNLSSNEEKEDEEEDVTHVSPLGSDEELFSPKENFAAAAAKRQSTNATGKKKRTSKSSSVSAKKNATTNGAAELVDEDRLDVDLLLQTMIQIDAERKRLRMLKPRWVNPNSIDYNLPAELQNLNLHAISRSTTMATGNEQRQQRQHQGSTNQRGGKRDAASTKRQSQNGFELHRPYHSAINRQRKYEQIDAENRGILARLHNIRPTPGMTRNEQLRDYMRITTYCAPARHRISLINSVTGGGSGGGSGGVVVARSNSSMSRSTTCSGYGSRAGSRASFSGSTRVPASASSVSRHADTRNGSEHKAAATGSNGKSKGKTNGKGLRRCNSAQELYSLASAVSADHHHHNHHRHHHQHQQHDRRRAASRDANKRVAQKSPSSNSGSSSRAPPNGQTMLGSKHAQNRPISAKFRQRPAAPPPPSSAGGVAGSTPAGDSERSTSVVSDRLPPRQPAAPGRHASGHFNSVKA